MWISRYRYIWKNEVNRTDLFTGVKRIFLYLTLGYLRVLIKVLQICRLCTMNSKPNVVT